MTIEFEESMMAIDSIVYRTIVPQLDILDGNQYNEFGDEMYDVYHATLCMSYHAMRRRGWTPDEISETLTNIEEHSENEQ